MSKKKNLSRRDMLKGFSGAAGSAIFSSPLKMLMTGIAGGIMTKAVSDVIAGDARRYIYISQPGAPSRWCFDLLLDPYNDGGFISNNYMGTKYTESGGRYTGVTYDASVSYGGLSLPWLWQFNVPSPGGGDRPLTQILDNCAILRGISTNNAGHPASRKLHSQPVPGTLSMGGLTADNSSTPIPAVDRDTRDYIFKSESSSLLRLADVRNQNVIDNILSPFNPLATPGFLAQKDALEFEIQQAMGSIEAFAASGQPGSNVTVKDRENAEELMRMGFENLDADWTALLNKYTDLVTRAIDSSVSMAGLTDLPIGTTGARGGEYQFDQGVVTSEADLRDMLTAQSNLQQMAESFAMTEYLLINNLSSSISFPCNNINSMTVNGSSNNNMNSDQHNVGSMVALLTNSMYFRALGSCTLALMDVMKATEIDGKNLFDESVIDISGEFNRSPRDNGSGADHGWQGKSCTFISGGIQGTQVLGNIRRDSGQNSYPGTWGYGAVNPSTGNQLTMADMGATLASLLRVPNPSANATPLIDQNGNPLVGRGELV